MDAKCSIEGRIEDIMTNNPTLTPDEKLQLEFNRWAEAGEGEKMEQHHLDITLKTLRLMDLRPGQRVLDLGCGSGWATRLLARTVLDESGSSARNEAHVAGLDVSDEMIRLARETSRGFSNLTYVVGSASQVPWGRITSLIAFFPSNLFITIPTRVLRSTNFSE